MSLSTIIRKPAGIPTGGEFAAHDRAEGTVALTIAPGDSLHSLTREEVAVIALDHLSRADAALEAANSATSLVDNGRHDGARHAHAEVVVRILNPGIDDIDAELAAEQLLNDRFNGVRVEDTDAFDPSELTATERAQVIGDLTRRADELFVEADSAHIPADVAHHTFARFEVLSDATAELTSR